MGVVQQINSDKNFWQEHPDLSFREAFAELRVKDKTKNHNESSMEMWAITIVYDIGEANKYRNYSIKDRIRIAEDDFLKKPGHFTKHRERLQPAIAEYNRLQADAPERGLADWLEQLDVVNAKVKDMLDDPDITVAQMAAIMKLRKDVTASYADYGRIVKQMKEQKAEQQNRGGKRTSGLEDKKERGQ